MKTLIFALILLVSSFATAADFYADAYRMGDLNHTGVAGLQADHWGFETSISEGGLSVTNRQYLAFQNIEIGGLFELTNNVSADALNYRSTEIGGGLSIIAKPYIKIGSDLFFSLSLDETNTPVFSVGFKLY